MSATQPSANTTVHDREAPRLVPEREHGRGEGDREAQPRPEGRRDRGRDDERRDQERGPEREERRAQPCRHRGERGGNEPRDDIGRGRDLRALPPLRLAGHGAPDRATQVGGERRRPRACRRVRVEGVIDGGEHAARQVGPLAGEGRSSGLDRARDLLQRDSPERMLVRERLPEDDADSPDVALGGRLFAGEPLRGDVRERSGHVSDCGQRVRTVELREPEVEKPDGELVLAVLDEDVRRLHVAVDDSRAVRMGEGIEELGGDLDRLLVGELPSPEHLAESPARHVLVGDVDVARVVSDVVGAHAPLVPQPLRGERLALGAGGSLPLAGDDLERDVEPRLLVAGEPDRAVSSAAEGADRAVAPEDELSEGCKGKRRHG